VQDVLKHCERALYIKNGLLVLDGPSREVSNEYLDDMFGRERQQDEAKPVLRHGGMPKFDRGNIEQFSIRPYYRKEEYRWGNGYARILDYQLQVNGREFPAVFYTHQELRIAFKVHFEREIGRPVFGLLIKTYDGVYLYGTNSQLAKRDGRPQHVSADEVQVAVFDFPLVLNAGAYLISVGVSEEQDQGELVPLDRRYDAILITVVNESAGSGLLDLGAVFHLNAVE
jgi:lipopolysaccharide transport system ATP-binding protein